MMPMVGAKPPALSNTLASRLHLLALHVDVQLHHLADLLQIGSIHRQVQRLARNGSWISSARCSSDTMPFLRAYVA